MRVERESGERKWRGERERRRCEKEERVAAIEHSFCGGLGGWAVATLHRPCVATGQAFVAHHNGNNLKLYNLLA